MKAITRTAALLILAGVLLATPLAGVCAPKATPKPAWEWPNMLKLATFSSSGSDYLLTNAWVPLHTNQTGMKWRVMAERSTPTVAEWLKQGRIDFWATGFQTPTEALEGLYGMATRDRGPFQVRVFYHSHTTPTGFIVRGDSDIKTIYDIKPGHSFACWSASTTFLQYYKAFRAYLGMTEKEFIMAPFGSYGASLKAMVEGKADICFAQPVSAAAYEIAANPHGIRYLEFPKAETEREKRFREVKPCEPFGAMELGVKQSYGVRMPLAVKGYFTRSNTDPELVYRLTKWLHENFDAYKSLYVHGPLMNMKYFRAALDENYLPVHEGTIRYLKEIGLWNAADDARQDYNVRLTTRYCKAYEDAMAMADEKGIKVEPGNKTWVELWSNYKKKLGLPRFKIMSNEEIKAALTELK